MKILILFAVFCCLTFGQSQVNSDKSPDQMDFYPYHVGDVWQYVDMPGWVYSTIKITRIDTVSADIHLIYINNSEVAFAKVDLDSSIIYRNIGEDIWITSYKLASPLKSYWIQDSLRNYWTYFYNEDTATVWGQEMEVRQYLTFHNTPFGDTSSMYGTTIHLVSGIGEYMTEYEIGEVRLSGCIINGVQYGIILGLDNGQNTLLPEDIRLQVYPNPFNPETVIRFTLPDAGFAKGVVYDILGREVSILLDGETPAGQHQLKFNAEGLGSGVYFFRLNAGKYSATIKMTVNK